MNKSINENLDNKYKQILENIKKGNIKKYDSNIKAYFHILKSNLFDEDYYFSKYNPPISKEHSLLHYLDKGYKEGKNPSEKFDGNGYLKKYPDVKKVNANPLVHYVKYGITEGRTPPLTPQQKIEKELETLKIYTYQNRIIQNINLLKSKVATGKKINIIFILPSMMFVYKELYNFFEKDELFNVKIVLVPHRIGNSPTITNVAKDKFFQILSYLKRAKFNVINGYDFENNCGIDLKVECEPDIVFYVLPYMRIYPETMKIDNLPPNILYAYIPYGEFLENDLDDNLYNFGWNEKIWKIFCSTKEYLLNSSKKSKVGSSNVILSGSARMDSLVNYKYNDGDYKWIYDKSENKKRIIWAPHHTLARPGMDEKATFSTFDKNYKFFYNFAKNNPDIEWVLRPHPLLKEILSEVNTYMKIEGVIDDNFVEDYFFKWNSLPNAVVHEEFDYIDLFATADAMITDCVSFKAEYLFANKPGLILTRDNVYYEGYKKTVTDAWYIENGSDFNKITEFIDNVVIDGNDYLKNKREEIFKEHFDYNVGKASKFIYNYIKNELI